LCRDGTWTAVGGSGLWRTQRGSREIAFTFDDNTTRYDGTRVSSTCYEGTMTTGVAGGPTGLWRGCYR
jgi:hypothetical protein